jgi:tRNA threonylcarbamoyladenosine biosynthesis protein TsaB
MPLILNLETATRMCSVALSENGKLLALKELGGEYTHAENLTLFIEDVFAQSQRRLKDLDAISVSKGPGSYTGLRIGVSTAKGLCYSLGIPLMGVGTLDALLLAFDPSPAIPNGEEQAAVKCPMLDARRMEVYCALYDSEGTILEPVSAKIIDEQSFLDYLEKGKVTFFGDGAMKCRTLITHPNALFVDHIVPSAKYMIPLSEAAFEQKRFEDVAYFEPYYLKDFHTGK